MSQEISASSAEASASRRPPTMGDVAIAAGVSRQSVSLVLRSSPGPSSETRDRVLQAAGDLGYRPDMAARMLRQRQSQHVGVLFNVSHAFEQDLIEHMYSVADELGYILMLTAITPARDEDRAVREMLGYRPGALVLVGAHLSPQTMRQVTLEVPVVQIGALHIETGADNVLTDGRAGIIKVVDHLVGLGHRDIAYIDGGNMPSATARKKGYLSGMRRAGLAPGTIVVGDYTQESGARAAWDLMGKPVLPTAVIASNDEMAAGLMNTLIRAGIKVPKDISITGYDDSRLARLSYNDLTTILQDTLELAKVALHTAAAGIADRSRPARQHLLVPELVIRSSTGGPPPVPKGTRGGSKGRPGQIRLPGSFQ